MSARNPILELLDPDTRALAADSVARRYGAKRFVMFVRSSPDDQFQPGQGFAPLPPDPERYALLERAAQDGPQFDPDNTRAAVPVDAHSVVKFSGSDGPVELDPHDADLLVAVGALLCKERDADDAEGPTNRHVRDVLESITDAFFLLDSDWRFTYANRRALELLGRERGALIGKNIWIEFPDAIGTDFHTEYQRAMEERVTVEFEEYYPPPLDDWYHIKAFPSVNGGLSVYFTQIGERRRLEESIRNVSTPIMDIGDRVLLVPLVGAFDRDRAAQLSERLFESIRVYRARVAVIDVTGLALMDSELVERLRTTLRGAHLLGCETITVGVSSDIARDLVKTAGGADAFRTCLDLKHGIELARRLLDQPATVRAV